MAAVRYHVIYHSEIAGKFDSLFRQRTALASASDSYWQRQRSASVPIEHRHSTPQ